MILARACLSHQSREAWKWADDANALHGAIWLLFPGVQEGPDSVARIRLLHRYEVDRKRGSLVLYLQSDRAPDWRAWHRLTFASAPETREIDAFHSGFAMGDRLRFRLRGHTVTRSRVVKESDAVLSWLPPAEAPPRRIRERALRGNDAIGWLTRHGEQRGFRVEVEPQMVYDEARLNAMRSSLAATTFDGVLTITDVAAFRTALASGVGRAKAFGMGLLSVARA